MKRSHIILLLIIFASIAVVIGTLHNSSTYSDFATAKNNKTQTFQIIGKLDKNKEIKYDSTLTNLSLSFFLTDNKKNECKVIYYGNKPNDFAKLDQVVVTGKMNDSVFIASEMLFKCPSKYQRGNEKLKQNFQK
ncbi:MAG: cytochrome c maturation protein CcmE [Bacteroidetes bacterium]|nr:cytochrome c maturation protein CcmE [Bacteroidota bacterium]